MVLVRRVFSRSAALDRFDDHSHSQHDDNHLGDENLLEDRKSSSSQNFDSFEISYSVMEVDSPQFFKISVDDWGDDNQSNKCPPHQSSIWMASLNESDVEESADDDNDDAKSDLFEDSNQANLKYLDGMFVCTGSKFNIQASSDDEFYSRPNIVSRRPARPYTNTAGRVPAWVFKPESASSDNCSSSYNLSQPSRFVRMGSKFNIQAPSDDEFYSRPNIVSPRPARPYTDTAGPVVWCFEPESASSYNRSSSYNPSQPSQFSSAGEPSRFPPPHRRPNGYPPVPPFSSQPHYGDHHNNEDHQRKQTYKWQNADGGGVLPYYSFGSSGPSAYHLPSEKELSRGIVRGRLSPSLENSLNHHAPESSTQPHETNLRNLVSLSEPGDAAGDRDDIMSDSTFGTGYDASISASFSNRGTDPLADKDLALAHSQSAGLTHPRSMIVSESQVGASEKRRILDGGKFPCFLCPQSFTAKHNLKSKSPTPQILLRFR